MRDSSEQVDVKDLPGMGERERGCQHKMEVKLLVNTGSPGYRVTCQIYSSGRVIRLLEAVKISLSVSYLVKIISGWRFHPSFAAFWMVVKSSCFNMIDALPFSLQNYTSAAAPDTGNWK